MLGWTRATIRRKEEWPRCQSLELLEQVLHVREMRLASSREQKQNIIVLSYEWLTSQLSCET